MRSADALLIAPGRPRQRVTARIMIMMVADRGGMRTTICALRVLGMGLMTEVCFAMHCCFNTEHGTGDHRVSKDTAVT